MFSKIITLLATFGIAANLFITPVASAQYGGNGGSNNGIPFSGTVQTGGFSELVNGSGSSSFFVLASLGIFSLVLSTLIWLVISPKKLASDN